MVKMCKLKAKLHTHFWQQKDWLNKLSQISSDCSYSNPSFPKKVSVTTHCATFGLPKLVM